MRSEATRGSTVAAGAGLVLCLLLTACGSPPTRMYIPPPPPIPAPRPAPPQAVAPSLQYFPNCTPQRRASADGSRAAVGVRAETCRTDAGEPGAFVVRLIDIQGIESPARRAGLMVGDQIVALDNCGVRSAGELTLEIEGVPEGNTTELLVRRAGRATFPVKVMTQRWRPVNPAQTREPNREQSLCQSIQRTDVMR